MEKFISKFEPADMIAMVVAVGGLGLMYLGIDGTVGTLLTTIVLFYFGKKEIVDKRKVKKVNGAKAETVEEIIKRVAKEKGINPDLALRVAKCESGLNPAAVNINTNKSKDRGLYQWNDKWHPEITDKVAFDAELSCCAFCDAVNAGNLSWWNASKKCWNV